jgi:hypothetical protein
MSTHPQELVLMGKAERMLTEYSTIDEGTDKPAGSLKRSTLYPVPVSPFLTRRNV